MKKLRSLLRCCLLLCLLAQACKKNKDEPPPAPRPIAFYKFDNQYTNNSISSLLEGEVIGYITSTLDSFLVPFSCYYFPGDSYLRVKDSDLIDFGTNQFTLSAWIKPVETQYTYLIAKHEGANSGSPYSLDIHPGVLRAFVRTTTDEQFLVTGKTAIVKGVWQHVAATFTGNELTIYYNGLPEGSVAVDRPLAITNGHLAIGGTIKYYPTGSFNGSMDNVKIFDKALSAEQVRKLYENYKD